MAKADFKMIYRKGVPPTQHKYPGLGYRISRERGMIV